MKERGITIIIVLHFSHSLPYDCLPGIHSEMQLKLLQIHHQGYSSYPHFHLSFSCAGQNFRGASTVTKLKETPKIILKCRKQMAMALPSSSLHPAAPIKFNTISASLSPLDLTEENIIRVLADAKVESGGYNMQYSLQLGQLFDTSVGITGIAELAELDGPYVKIRLRGRFWHQRSVVLARLGNYLKQRIPEILEVDIEDEKQLDDSPENF